MHNLKLPSHIPLASSYDPLEFARLKVESHNRTTGNMTDYDCPKCLNRGDIAYLREDGRADFRGCDCQRIRKNIENMKVSGLKQNIRFNTFDRFQARAGWQQQLLEGCRSFAEKPQGWLLLSGQSGCGKTHLCTAVCRELLYNDYSVISMPWRDHIRNLKRLDTDEQRDKLLDELKKYQVLFIDDLFKTGRGPDGQARPTAADVNLAFEILNYRYNNRLITIISTEKSPQELVNIDEATGSRIVEMARQHCYHIHEDGYKNIRLLK